MAVSRSALQFFKRAGLSDEPLNPKPRMCAEDFIITRPRQVPGQPATPQLTQAILVQLEGDPSPDRNVSRPWPDDA